MWKRFSRIHLIPLIGALVICYFLLQLSGKIIKEWQSWDEIARHQIETEAVVIDKRAEVSASGQVSKYEITYEFVAPAAEGGSNYSRVGLSEKLKENFFEHPEKKIGQIKMPEPRTDGNQYFSKTQTLEPGFFNNHGSGNIIQIVYAQNNPQNSLIKGGKGNPLLWIFLPLGLLILLGYLIYLCVLPAFRLKA